MAQIIYTGGAGRRKITAGGIRFETGNPVTVADESMAARMLAKRYFIEQAPADDFDADTYEKEV